MLDIQTLGRESPPLQSFYWPPVGSFNKFAPELDHFLGLSMTEQRARLADLRPDQDAHGRFLHKCLSAIYAYIFGYRDSPCHLAADDELEVRLQRAKISLEREMLEHFLRPEPVPQGLDIRAACDYLRDHVAHNAGVAHPFFDFLRDEAGLAAYREFLRIDVIRNEVVDDEVALITVGLQGLMKKVMTSNLWDECGNGNLAGFHTYWLRRLLEHTGDWEGLEVYRRDKAPWFAGITSNSLNMLLTRPGYKYRAYGHFLVTEGWVAPHFERVVAGLQRVGLRHRDITVYFTAHLRIDPHHTDEMLEGLLYQQPALTQREIDEIILGAHSAASAGVHMYDRMLSHLKSIAC